MLINIIFFTKYAMALSAFKLGRSVIQLKHMVYSAPVLQRRFTSYNSFNNTLSGIQMDIKPVSNDVFKYYTIDRYTKDVATMTTLNLAKIGGFTTLSLCIGSALLPYTEPLAMSIGSLIGGTAIAIYSIFKLGDKAPKFVQIHKEKKNSEYIVEYSSMQKLHLNALMLGEALIISPLVYLCLDSVPAALFITGGLMIAPIATAYALPKNSMLPIGSALLTGLCGMLCISVVGMFVPTFGQIWFSYEPWLGIGLFSLYNAYDTHVMLKSYEERCIDPMAHSINYTLNCINIFIRVLEILANSKQKHK